MHVEYLTMKGICTVFKILVMCCYIKELTLKIARTKLNAQYSVSKFSRSKVVGMC